jgi:hypothetical protein
MRATAPQSRSDTSPPWTNRPRRAQFTDRLFYRWEHLRLEQQQAAWSLVESLRASMARRRRREMLWGSLVVIGVVADTVAMYVVLHAPMR